jgi:hypothetical protein
MALVFGKLRCECDIVVPPCKGGRTLDEIYVVDSAFANGLDVMEDVPVKYNR